MLTLVGGACAFTKALAQVPTDCPTVLVASAAEVNSLDNAEFQATVKGGSADVDPLYNWTVSAGIIVSGQGTSGILVTAEGMAAGDVITATVDVLGYPGSCDTAASASSTVVKKALKVFEGAYANDDVLIQHLYTLFENRAQGGKVYIVLYAGRGAPAGEVDRIRKVAKQHIENAGEDPADYPFLEGGKRDQTTIAFWMAGPGDEAPAPDATN